MREWGHWETTKEHYRNSRTHQTFPCPSLNLLITIIINITHDRTSSPSHIEQNFYDPNKLPDHFAADFPWKVSIDILSRVELKKQKSVLRWFSRHIQMHILAIWLSCVVLLCARVKYWFSAHFLHPPIIKFVQSKASRITETFKRFIEIPSEVFLRLAAAHVEQFFFCAQTQIRLTHLHVLETAMLVRRNVNKLRGFFGLVSLSSCHTTPSL